MQYYMVLGKSDGRVLSVAAEGFHCGDGEALVEVPEGFTLENATEWVLQDGQWAHTPIDVLSVTLKLAPWEVNAANIDFLAMMAVHNDLVELFEAGAAEGKPVLAITGEDVAAFCDELLRNARTYTEDWRESLNRDIRNHFGKGVQRP